MSDNGRYPPMDLLFEVYPQVVKGEASIFFLPQFEKYSSCFAYMLCPADILKKVGKLIPVLDRKAEFLCPRSYHLHKENLISA